MMALADRARYLLEYAAVRVLLAGVLSMGIDRGLRVAVRFGALLYRVDGRHRRRALDHLGHAFPELTPAKREAIAKSSFQSFCRTVVESVYAERLLTPSTLGDRLRLSIHPAAARALAAGGGAVLVSAHLGNWELSGNVMGLLGHSMLTVARPIENPYLNRLMTRRREQRGQRIACKRGAVRTLARALRDGDCVGIISDQHAGRDGLVVRYFGRAASTTAAPATLALRFQVPLIPGCTLRRSGSFRFEFRLSEPLAPPDSGDMERDVLELTQAMTARLEAWVREEPGQWLWAHRRWRADRATPESSTPGSGGAPRG